MRRFFRAWPVATFLPLAFALSWYPWLIALAQGRSSGPNPLGPLVAALLVLGLGSGWPALKALLAAIVRGRVAPRWYALAFGLPVAIVALAVALNAAFGAPWPAVAQLARWPTLVEPFLFILLFIALGEEPGWRGFLQPRLQDRFGPIAGTLLLAAVWALWHLPLLGTEFAPSLVAPFLLSVFGASFVLARLYDGARGSVLLPMLMHATVNTTGAGFAFGFVDGADLVRLWWINALLWLAAGAFAAWKLSARRP